MYTLENHYYKLFAHHFDKIREREKYYQHEQDFTVIHRGNEAVEGECAQQRCIVQYIPIIFRLFNAAETVVGIFRIPTIQLEKESKHQQRQKDE